MHQRDAVVGRVEKKKERERGIEGAKKLKEISRLAS